MEGNVARVGGSGVVAEDKLAMGGSGQEETKVTIEQKTSWVLRLGLGGSRDPLMDVGWCWGSILSWFSISE